MMRRRRCFLAVLFLLAILAHGVSGRKRKREILSATTQLQLEEEDDVGAGTTTAEGGGDDVAGDVEEVAVVSHKRAIISILGDEAEEAGGGTTHDLSVSGSRVAEAATVSDRTTQTDESLPDEERDAPMQQAAQLLAWQKAPGAAENHKEVIIGPPYESLRNKIAIAEVHRRDGEYMGSVSFDWCHNADEDTMQIDPSVLVALRLDKLCPVQWGRKGDAQPAKFSKCAYQISLGSIGAETDGAACTVAKAAKVWNPLQATVQTEASDNYVDFILEEIYGEPSDKCDSTHYTNRTASCPAGALSRTHGSTKMYYDRFLGKHDKIIGRTLLLVGAAPDGYELSCSPIRFAENCAYKEKLALLELKASSRRNGSGTPLETWMPHGDMCNDFTGVSCDIYGHVSEVILPYPKIPPRIPQAFPAARAEGAEEEQELLPRLPQPPLQGIIPDSIGQLSHLMVLDLSGQEMTGLLPSSLDGAKKLRKLKLRGNKLSGSLPESLGNLEELEELDVSNNKLRGTLPPEVLDLPQLRIINATSNDGICGSFVYNNTDLVVILEDCDSVSGPELTPGHLTPFTQSTLFLVLAVSIVPAIFVLAFSICCWTYIMHKNKAMPSRGGAGDPSGVEEMQDITPLSQDSTRSLKTFEGQGSAAFDSEGYAPGVNVHVFAEKGVCNSGSGVSRSPAACPAGVGTPSTERSRQASGALSPAAHQDDDAPKTPALKTRCPSGYSPLEYARLPDTVKADEARILGSGGYGVVYYATYVSPSGEELPAAVKVISNSDYDDLHKGKFKTFKDEIEMLKHFDDNDCIVQVYTYCLDFPRAYIVYEFLPNDTLARTIHGLGVRQSYLQILQIGYGIAEALHALHQRQIVHRDLKPDNILMDAHMRPKLCDFGISRKRDSAVSALSTHNLGTWSYMAPEQFHGKVSEKSDIYAVGLILWECWTLQRPWNAADERDLWGVVYAILNENKRPEIPESCPKSLRSLLEDCWETEPGLRPTALQLKERIWKIMTVQSRRKPPAVGGSATKQGEQQSPLPDEQRRPAEGPQQQGGAQMDAPVAFLRQLSGSGSLRSPEPYRFPSPDTGATPTSLRL